MTSEIKRKSLTKDELYVKGISTSNYAVFFNDNNNTYRLPTNPEEIELSSTQAIEKYEVLKLGQIAVPTHMELKEYSFECEFPKEVNNYVETRNDFKNADFYINLLTEWRNKLIPVQFIAGKVTSNEIISIHGNSIKNLDVDGSINVSVLIKELTIKEKAGEEGDKYISFKLLEYKEYGMALEVDKDGKKKKKTDSKTNPKNNGYYIVQAGDCLWAIAKKYYGDGAKYTKIVSANKDKIHNPSLIQPGWKLVIPA